jgi:hypothetical protein
MALDFSDSRVYQLLGTYDFYSKHLDNVLSNEAFEYLDKELAKLGEE